MSTVRRTIELDVSTDARLSDMAARRGQDVASVISDAIELLDSALDIETPDLAEDRRRLEEFKRTGMAVPLSDAKAWTESWGTDAELPCPAPRKHG